MLAITDAAAEAIKGVVSSQGVPEGAGLRIATPPEGAPEGGLEVALVAVPAEDDEVIDEAGRTSSSSPARPRRSTTTFSTRRSRRPSPLHSQ